MKWEIATLISKVKTGEDALGNNIYEDKDISTVNVRFSPWNENQINLEDREVTLKEKQVIVAIPYKDFPKCENIRIEDNLFKIKQKIDLYPRFTMLQIKGYKDV